MLSLANAEIILSFTQFCDIITSTLSHILNVAVAIQRSICNSGNPKKTR